MNNSNEAELKQRLDEIPVADQEILSLSEAVRKFKRENYDGFPATAHRMLTRARYQIVVHWLLLGTQFALRLGQERAALREAVVQLKEQQRWHTIDTAPIEPLENEVEVLFHHANGSTEIGAPPYENKNWPNTSQQELVEYLKQNGTTHWRLIKRPRK